MYLIATNDPSWFERTVSVFPGTSINHEPIEIVRSLACNHAIGIQLVLFVGLAALIHHLLADDLEGGASFNFSSPAPVLALAPPHFLIERNLRLRSIP